jgi:hypothetical protein
MLNQSLHTHKMGGKKGTEQSNSMEINTDDFTEKTKYIFGLSSYGLWHLVVFVSG